MYSFSASRNFFWVLLQLLHSLILTRVDGSLSNKCDLDGYYFSRLGKEPSQWSRDSVASLLASTHTMLIPFVGSNPGSGDVLEALIELDPGRDGRDLPPSTSVNLFYSNKNVAKYPLDRTIWVPEHINPLFTDSVSNNNFLAAFSDLHNIRPAHPELHESIRGTKYFGLCPSCSTSNFAKTMHHDACICGDFFQPPESSRGPIARALLYMQLRYPELKMSNCHTEQLLAWHNFFPPTSQEQIRNLRICYEWQGNRNPFVDFPSLAFTMDMQEVDCTVADWGEINTDVADRLDNIFGEIDQREQSDFQKPSQEGEIDLGEVFEEGIIDGFFRPDVPGVDSCADMLPGDVYFHVLQAEPAPRIGIISLVDLPIGLTFYLSNTLSFHTRGSPNIEVADDYPDPPLIRLTLEQEVSRGNSFGFGKNLLFGFDWEVITEPLSVRGNAFGGDEFFVFCRDDNEQIRLLSAITTNGSFREDQVEEEIQINGFGQTILPKPMNYYAYSGPHFAKNDSYQRALMDPSNWLGAGEQNSIRLGEDEGSYDPSTGEDWKSMDSSGSPAYSSILPFRKGLWETFTLSRTRMTITSTIGLLLFECIFG